MTETAPLPDPPDTLDVLDEGLHGLRLRVPLDREALPRYAAAVVALLAALTAGLYGWLLLPALLVTWWVLPDRRHTELELDGDALTLTSTTLGVPRSRRIPLHTVRAVEAEPDPPQLVIHIDGTDALRLAWGGTPAELGWLASAISHQAHSSRAAPPPAPPPELERLRDAP